CIPVRRLLPAYVDRRANEAEASTITTHIAQCADCAATLADLRDVRTNLGVLLIPAAAAVIARGPLSGLSATTAAAAWTGLVTAKSTALFAGITAAIT